VPIEQVVRVLFQPVGVAIAAVLSLYAANLGEVEFSDALRSLVIASSAAILLWLAALRVLGDARRAALLTSLVALLFWSSGSIALTIEGIAGGGYVAPALAMVLLWLVALPALARRIARTARDLSLFYEVANVVAAVAVLLPIAVLAVSLGQMSEPAIATSDQPSPTPASRRRSPPDIYLVILDAHGRDDELAEYFGMRDGLGQRLRELGFYVADDSNSNYSTTLHSLPSLLNFDMIQNLIECTPHTDARSILTHLVRESRFMTAMKKRGYKTIAYSTGIPVTEHIEADVFVDSPPLITLWGRAVRVTAFEQALLTWTPLGIAIRHSPKLSPYTLHRERISNTLSDIATYAPDPAPTFVFAHVIAPHEPFVFGAHGEDVSTHEIPFRFNRIFDDPQLPIVPGLVGPEYARRYRDQARYVDGLVVRSVREILRNSSKPPIIIVMGDHGPYGFTPDVRRARFAILNAYHLPHGGQRLLYPSISPVNSLRVVLNYYFGAKFPILPDQSFRADWDDPCSFAEEAPARAAH